MFSGHYPFLLSLFPAPLTLLQNLAQAPALVGAVPAVVAKLVLALPHAQTGALDHLLHDLRLGLAQLGVFAPQAPGLPADAVVVHHQWATQHPERMTQRERERERE